MSDYTFDVAAFRVSYPEFSNSTTYPDATLQMYYDTATCYISDTNYGYLNGACRYRALTLMTAHLAKMFDAANADDSPVLLQSATVDKVSVTTTPPPLKNEFQFWLNLSAYGQQLLVLLSMKSVGGFTVGALPESAAFRRVGGVFI